MTRKKESITLSLDIEDKAALEAIALQLGEVWGNEPNISKLMRSIAQGKYLLTPSASPQGAYIEAIRQAVADAEKALKKLKKVI